MSNNIQISCILNTNNPTAKLGFEGWIDDQRFINIDHVQEEQKILIEITDDEAKHELKFVLKNKTIEDTKIDSDGNIISDACLTIDNITFDDIKLGHTFTKLAEYQHDFNGTGPITTQQFFGEMGCNGTVTLKFTTPIYMWLLEHM